RQHTRSKRDWSSDVCSSDLYLNCVKFKIETYAAMIGLVSGSIYAILRNLDSAFDNQTILLSFITFFAGVFFLIILKQIQFNKYRSEERRVGRECRLWML